MSHLLDPRDYQTAHLVLLVGRNPVPNYVAAELLLKPNGQLYLAHSSRTEQTAKNLSRYWTDKRGGQKPELVRVDEVGGVATYGMISDILKEIAKRPDGKGQSVGLHYTGGTKAMAVAAYRAVFDKWQFQPCRPVFSYLDAGRHSLYIAQGTTTGFTGNLLLAMTPDLGDLVKLHALDLKKDIARTPLYASLASELCKAYGDNNRHATKTARDAWREFCDGTFRNEKKAFKAPADLASTVFQFPDHPALRTFVGKFQQDVAPDGQTLGDAAHQTGFADAKTLAEWLDGKWLEHYVLSVVKDIQDNDPACHIHACGMNIEPIPDPNHPNFEVDVGAMQGYRLYAISCYTGGWRDMAKLKLFEAYERARNMGGDETFVGLIYFGDDAADLEKRVALNWNPEGQIRVFGIREARNLGAALRRWFQGALAERGEFVTVYTLTVLDTGQIQQYVFGSNRLLENVGASELVEQAARSWVRGALPLPHNMQSNEIEDRRIERDGLAAEVVYAGGGNTVLLFRDRTEAVNFVQRLTLETLRRAPGLQVTAVHKEFDWENQDQTLMRVLGQTLSQVLPRKKALPTPSMPLLGLGVTAACNSTGLVASEWRAFEEADDQPRLISREVAMKRAASGAATRRFYGLLPQIREQHWAIPRDLDDLGRVRGEESYIAVVHADGNRMGERIERVAAEVERRYPPPERNREYILTIRSFSETVRDASSQAMRATMELLWDALQADPSLPHTTRDGQPYFPLRPIVFGGDDTTFVCHGQYGLPLAVHYLAAFEQATQEQFERAAQDRPSLAGQRATARAGVAVVKVHYPFARAYSLSEELAGSAKSYIYAQRADVSALDWHFAASGITGKLTDIRHREYEPWIGGQTYHLTMRPVLLRDHDAEWRTWPIMQRLLDMFLAQGWRESRNKTMALRTVLRQGPDAVRQFIRAYRLPGGTLPTPEGFPQRGNFAETGWIGNTCVYFDAIEALDFYMDLAAKARRGGTHDSLLATV